MINKDTSVDVKTNDAVVLLSAFGIHTGGGLVLVKALIKALGGSIKAASFDSRCNHDASFASLHGRIEYVRRSFLARILAIVRLTRMTSLGDTLLCFNSLPPLTRPKGRVVLFVQAPHFVGDDRGIRYTQPTALRIKIERLWFKFGIGNCDEIWVQSPRMQEVIRHQFPKANTRLVPLVDDELAERLSERSRGRCGSKGDDSRFTFFYPADAVGHKNHENLLRAWGILATEKRTPKLLLTLQPSEMRSVQARAKVDSHGLSSVVNLGRLSRDDVLRQMGKSSALIFPSQAETFGLPMLEARALGVPVVASERDFVRDVCVPQQTFDPNSPRSIAMAVLRFMDGDVSLRTEYCSPGQFASELLS